MKKKGNRGILKLEVLRARWWWQKRDQEAYKSLRRSAILYEFAARLDAVDAINLAYWYGRPWIELDLRQRQTLNHIWPTKVVAEYYHVAENEKIQEALQQPPCKPWSPWCLISFNLQHDNNALLQALREQLDVARNETGMLRCQPTMGMPKVALSFTCVEAKDRQLAGLELTESQATTLRRKIAEYRPQIEAGRQQFKLLSVSNDSP